MSQLRRFPLIWALAGLVGVAGGVGACKQDDDRVEGSAEENANGDGIPSAQADESAGGDEGNSSDLDGRFDLGPTPDFSEGGGEGGNEGPTDEKCDIDFLFVIDNSGTMESEQDSLVNSVPEFVTTVTEEIPNLETFHIAAVTTQAYRENGPGCQEMGGMVTQTGTRFSSNRVCTPYASGGSYMTEEDDLLDKFDCAARAGTGDGQYGDERPMEALEKALSGDNVAEGGCNEGFLRDDALLVVTVITDEEDDNINPGEGSPGDPTQWHDALLATKGGAEEMVVVLGLLGTEASTECEALLPTGMGEGNFDGAELSPRLEAFVKSFGERGFVGDVCADNYDPFFEKAISVIDFACDNIIPPE